MRIEPRIIPLCSGHPISLISWHRVIMIMTFVHLHAQSHRHNNSVDKTKISPGQEIHPKEKQRQTQVERMHRLLLDIA